MAVICSRKEPNPAFYDERQQALVATGYMCNKTGKIGQQYWPILYEPVEILILP